MGKIVFVLALFLGNFVVGMFGYSGCSYDRGTIVIVKSTELLQKADRKEAEGNKVITVLREGTEAKIINVRYSKEYMFYKVRTEEGQLGYVMYGDNLNVLSKKE
jgi:type II secretory pathway component HofQ